MFAAMWKYLTENVTTSLILLGVVAVCFIISPILGLVALALAAVYVWVNSDDDPENDIEFKVDDSDGGRLPPV